MTIPTITRTNVTSLGYRDVVHYTGPSGKNPRGNRCHETIGPRGGLTVSIVECRINGQVKLWKTRPADFSVPVKYGMYENGSIFANSSGRNSGVFTNGEYFHLAKDCVPEVYCHACGWATGAQGAHGTSTPCKYAPAPNPNNDPGWKQGDTAWGRVTGA